MEKTLRVKTEAKGVRFISQEKTIVLDENTSQDDLRVVYEDVNGPGFVEEVKTAKAQIEKGGAQ